MNNSDLQKIMIVKMRMLAIKYCSFCSIKNVRNAVESMGKVVIKWNLSMIGITFFFSFISLFASGNENLPNALLEKAELYYENKEYAASINFYEQAKSHIELKDTSVFKLAIAKMKLNQYDEASVLFEKLTNNSELLPTFSQYFYLKNLWKINPDRSLRLSVKYIAKYKKHPLADSLLIEVAQKYEDDRNYEKARIYYLSAVKREINVEKETFFAISAAHMLAKLNREKQALDEYRQIIRKYQKDKSTAELCKTLKQKYPQFYKENFFTIATVFYKTQAYDYLRKELETYIKSETDHNNIAKARFNLLKIYYAKGQYGSALYGFRSQLKKNKLKSLKANLKLFIARTLYKQRKLTEAIEAYLEFAREFPRNRLAAAAVWKSAWIYEEQKKTEDAMRLYQRLRQKKPHNPFQKEAYFREGFSLYRLGKYKEADQIFSQIRFKKWPDIHINRAQYWSSICRDKQKDGVTARRLRMDLARKMWDDYYTMKSYLLHKTEMDTSSEQMRKLKENLQRSSSYIDGYASLTPLFAEAFLARRLLGEKYSQIVSSYIDLNIESQNEWIALAEIFKKLGKHGKAYRVFDHINKQYYPNVSFFDKVFILKERFPKAYEHAVGAYSLKYGIEKELIWAVMKQESAFQYNALSKADAWGLMQLIPETAKNVAKVSKLKLRNASQLFQPEINVRLGTVYLKQLNQKFKGRKECLLAAYNAGPDRAKRWKKIHGSDETDVFIENIEFTETRGYVRKVMKNYWAYQLLYNDFKINKPPSFYGINNK
jgi:soluble lytic murein transglycosylase-like protein/tetratricopeptide (TPR) repeat protein